MYTARITINNGLMSGTLPASTPSGVIRISIYNEYGEERYLAKYDATNNHLYMGATMPVSSGMGAAQIEEFRKLLRKLKIPEAVWHLRDPRYAVKAHDPAPKLKKTRGYVTAPRLPCYRGRR